MTPIACLACAAGGNWLIYSVAAGESLSVTGLLMAGIVPAILLGGAMVILSCIAAWWKGYSVSPRGLSFRGVKGQMPRVFLAVVLPILFLGGLIRGMWTPTQAAAIAVVHIVWMGYCIMREIRGQSPAGALVYAGLYILLPFALPLALVYGLVHFPYVYKWLPNLFGY